MAPMASKFPLLIAALAVCTSTSAAAQQSVNGSAGLVIKDPAGLVVVQDILSNVNAALVISGSAGEAISFAAPASVNVSNASGGEFSLATQLSVNNVFLSGDTVNVRVAALNGGEQKAAQPGAYGGVMVVLAQYN